MPREAIPDRRDLKPQPPEWETFQVGTRAENHLTVATYPGMRVALCGLHLEVRRLLPLELAPDAQRCAACERRLQPAGPDHLTPDAFRRVAEAELQLRWDAYRGTPERTIRRFLERLTRDWERILMQLKGDTQ